MELVFNIIKGVMIGIANVIPGVSGGTMAAILNKKEKIMELVFNIIKGVMIGIANVIPGVSGGTMAVSFGIYDRLINSISGFTKHVKESLALLSPVLLGCVLGIAGFTYAIEYLLENHTFVMINSISGFTKHVKESLALLSPVLLGCVLGIAGFTYAIEYLLENHTFVTCMTFVGLILGGLPALYRAMNEKKATGSGKMGAGAILAFLMAFTVSAGLPLLKTGGDTMTVLPVNGSTMAILYHGHPLCAGDRCLCHHGDPWRIRLHDAHGPGLLLRHHQHHHQLFRRTPGHGPGGLKGRLPAVSSLWHRRSPGDRSHCPADLLPV